MTRISIAALAVAAAACAKPPAPKPPSHPASTAPAPDEFTRFSCASLDAKAGTLVTVVDCQPGGGTCSLSYTATRVTSGDAGYSVGAQVPVFAEAHGWRAIADGERLHVDVVDGATTRLVIEGMLSGAWGTEGTLGREYVGVARTPDAGTYPMAAVSLAGAPKAPAQTRDELRVAVRCALATDLQE